MNIGERIIDEIIKQGMIKVVNEPEPWADEGYVFKWNANAAEQLTALIAEEMGKPRGQKRFCVAATLSSQKRNVLSISTVLSEIYADTKEQAEAGALRDALKENQAKQLQVLISLEIK